MAEQVLVQFRADKLLKQEAIEIYESLGMDLPTAFRMFMKRSVLEKGLPFEAKLPQPTGEVLVDMDDLVFYEVVMEKRDEDAYLVTGNQKYYPIKDFIVTPAEMMKIIEK